MSMMLSVSERRRLKSDLISGADADSRVIGAAVLGPGAIGREDQWSDIDLAFPVSRETDHAEVIADWTDRMYGSHRFRDLRPAPKPFNDQLRGLAIEPELVESVLKG